MWKSEILEIKRHFRRLLRLLDEDLFFGRTLKKNALFSCYLPSLFAKDKQHPLLD